MPPIPKSPSTDFDPKLLSRAHPRTPGDAIVISGVSGKFPNSRNVEEYAHNLYNKVRRQFEALAFVWNFFLDFFCQIFFFPKKTFKMEIFRKKKTFKMEIFQKKALKMKTNNHFSC